MKMINFPVIPKFTPGLF